MSPRITRVLLAAAAAALTAATAGSAAAQTPPSPANYTRREKAAFGDQASKPKLLTGSVQMTKEDTAPARGYTAPTSMAADPEDPRVIVGAVANLRARTCHLVRSTDAGRTWTFSKTPPAPSGYPFCTSTMLKLIGDVALTAGDFL